MPHEIIFKEQSIMDFTRSLGSSAATPGGGATGALTAAQGASLIAMVCSLTVGKERFAQHEDLVATVLKQSNQLNAACLALMDDDAIAFHAMIAVYKMPKSTQEEKDMHAVAKEQALKTCTLPPLQVMAAAIEGLSLAQSILGKSNENAVSDLGVAASCFKSALESSWLNVVINLKEIKDADFVAEHEAKGNAFLTDGIAQADQLYQSVLRALS